MGIFTCLADVTHAVGDHRFGPGVSRGREESNLVVFGNVATNCYEFLRCRVLGLCFLACWIASLFSFYDVDYSFEMLFWFWIQSPQLFVPCHRMGCAQRFFVVDLVVSTKEAHCDVLPPSFDCGTSIVWTIPHWKEGSMTNDLRYRDNEYQLKALCVATLDFSCALQISRTQNAQASPGV